MTHSGERFAIGVVRREDSDRKVTPPGFDLRLDRRFFPKQVGVLGLFAGSQTLGRSFGFYRLSEALARDWRDTSREGTARMPEEIVRSEQEWGRLLTPEQSRITRKKGTERAFTGEYHDFKGAGVYQCVCCSLPLFSSRTKFDFGGAEVCGRKGGFIRHIAVDRWNDIPIPMHTPVLTIGLNSCHGLPHEEIHQDSPGAPRIAVGRVKGVHGVNFKRERMANGG